MTQYCSVSHCQVEQSCGIHEGFGASHCPFFRHNSVALPRISVGEWFSSALDLGSKFVGQDA